MEFDFPIEIKGLQVYKATLKGVFPADEPRLIVSVMPAEAYVEIDGQPVKNDNGTVNIPIEKGTYSYTVRAPGYETATGTWNCEGSGVETQIVSLKQPFSTLEITTYPETDVKLYIQDKYVGTTPWPKNDEERKQAQFTPGMYRVRAEKESIFSIDTSVFISELGKSYKETLYTQQRWIGSYKYDYKPLTVLVGFGWTLFKVEGKFANAGNVDLTLRHWLHRKPLPTKLRFAMDYKLQATFNIYDYRRGLIINWHDYFTVKNLFFGGILIGPSLTWTPAQSGMGQLSAYAHVGYKIGEGNGAFYSNNSFTDAGRFPSSGFTSAVGLSFAFKKIGIACEYVFNRHSYSYSIDGTSNNNSKRKGFLGEHGLRLKLFVKIGK